MIERARHVPLRLVPWDPSDIATAIEEIVVDTLGHFDNEGFWPAHPLDDLRKSGNSSVYLGASGVIWALDYLHRAGATKSRHDFSPVLSQLLERTRVEMRSFGDYAKHGSLLFGDLGTALVMMRLEPTGAIADIVHARVNANMELPVRELMWGLPGSMLACIHMAEMTDEARWRTAFEAQAKRLLDDLKETAGAPIWTQDSVRRATAVPWAGARVCGEHDPAHPRVELADGSSAHADCRCRSAHLERTRSPLRPWHFMASRRRRQESLLPALPRCSRHGHDVRRRPVHLAGVRGPVARRGQNDLGSRTARQGLQSLSWHGRQWLCVSQAAAPNRRCGVARTRPSVRHDRRSPMPRNARSARAGPVLSLDRRHRPCSVPLALFDAGTGVSDS